MFHIHPDVVCQEKLINVDMDGAQAALLLPTEVASSREVITPELVKDHIIFCDGSDRNDAPFVTLSGLRGTIE